MCGGAGGPSLAPPTLMENEMVTVRRRPKRKPVVTTTRMDGKHEHIDDGTRTSKNKRRPKRRPVVSTGRNEA